MNVHLIQCDLVWENAAANRASIQDLIGTPEKGGIIILPEMFNTGFTFPNEQSIEDMQGPTLAWMKTLSKQLECVITGSLIIQEEGKHFNRMCWVEPDGKTQYYNKRHLFRMGGEDERFTAGDKNVIVTYKGIKICLQICYDLRFPVWSRNRFKEGEYEYDLLIYVANWPEARHHAWQGLLRARAMENIAYCTGVNRVGKDGNGLSYKGGSALIDPIGVPIHEAGDSEEHIVLKMDLDFLKSFRKKFPVGLDADCFSID